MSFRKFLLKILDCLYYRKCYICGKKCYDISLCDDCKNKIFDNLKFKQSDKFGAKLYVGSVYEGELQKIIRALKYHKKMEFSMILSEIILKTVEHCHLDLKDYVIVPVPIHKNRLKKRKYNHMELVANAIAKEFSIESNTILKRIKDTEPLYKLSVFDRKKVILDAFEVTENIAGKNILLVDDIITSGSTIGEIIKKLKEKSPASIIVICTSYSNNCNFLR